MMGFALQPGLVLLAVISAFGYAAATAGIKLAANGFSLPALLLVLAGFSIAAATEATLLRQSSLSIIYISIIALETILVLGMAMFLGDRLTALQLAGGAMVVTGLAMVSN
jgi:hypothetical protein